ncbi:MAG TPA: hypothetical protein VFY99_05435 [Solirubrobacterales bacterium]
MLSRIRYFFEDIGYWFSDRLGLGRRRRRNRGALPEAGAGAAPAAEPPPAESPPAGATAAAPEVPAHPPPADVPPPQPKRRRFRRRKRTEDETRPATEVKPEDAGAAAAAGPAVASPATDPSAAETAQLQPTAPPAKRSRFGRPSLPRPSLPRPRLPRPSRPKLRRPGRPGKRGVIIGVVVLLAAAVAAVYLATDFDFGGGDAAQPPAPRIVIEEGEAAPQPKEAPELGFPAFATKNTTRVSGANPIADAAGVALATAPATGGVEGPAAVSIVAEDDWPAAIAASSLVAEPIGAPILLSQPDEVPELTLTALSELAPKGSPETGDNQLFRFGGALAPEGLRAQDVDGANPAELAAEAAAERERLTGEKPEHVVLVSSDRPEFAMPAAAWAARSGDPVLFVQSESVPTPTLEALRELEDVPAYVLGPAPVVSNEVIDQIAKETKAEPKRIGEDDAVSNSIAFARYSDGSFGWNVTDPGHGLVLANATRPADAGAAAPLSASGKWGPLLLTDNAEVLPAPLEGYLLDIKPGYVDDPTRAVYNHAWLIGDQEAISVDVQAQVDELLELAKVQSGRGQDSGTLPGQGEPESQPDTGDKP